MVGIISALVMETELLLSAGENTVKETVTGIDFYKTTINGVNCVITVRAVGKVNAARCTEAMILRYSPDFIINTGIAGALSDSLSIGDIVISSRVLQHDMDTSAIGDEPGFLSEPPLVYLPANEKLIGIFEKTAAELSFRAFIGTVASGDQFVSTEEQKNRIVSLFSADAAEMEGGAVGQVCYLSGVPFVVIRAISDGGNSESHIDYPTFAKMAAEKGSQLVEKALTRIAAL